MIEIALLDNKDIVYGTYEEVEEYCELNSRWVINYFDHLWPGVVQKEGKYVGKSMCDPYSLGGSSTEYMDYKIGKNIKVDKW